MSDFKLTPLRALNTIESEGITGESNANSSSTNPNV